MNRFYLFIFSFLMIGLLSSCAETNVDSIQPNNTSVPEFIDFRGNKNQVWQAALRALSEKEIIKTTNENGGLIVTGFGAVDDRELDLIKTALLAKTYKYSYTVFIKQQSQYSSRVTVKVNLLIQQVGFLAREVKDYRVNNYLRYDLYNRICKYLSPGNPSGCKASASVRGKNRGPTFPTDSPAQQPVWTRTSQVREVQEKLHAQGYNPGRPDGMMGKRTRNALIQFQEDRSIPVTSLMDGATLVLLGVEGVVEERSQERAVSTGKIEPKPGKLKSEQVVSKASEKKPGVGQITTPKVKSDISSGRELSGDYHYMTLSPTVIKKSPKVMSDTLTEVKENTVLVVLEEGEEWLKVSHGGKVGYVYSSLVEKKKGKPASSMKKEKKMSTSAMSQRKQEKLTEKGATPELAPQKTSTPDVEKEKEETAETKVIGTGVVNDVTRLYKKPSVMSSSLLSVAGGTRVTLLEGKRGFYKTTIKDMTGYIYKDFVTLD